MLKDTQQVRGQAGNRTKESIVFYRGSYTTLTTVVTEHILLVSQAMRLASAMCSLILSNPFQSLAPTPSPHSLVIASAFVTGYICFCQTISRIAWEINV